MDEKVLMFPSFDYFRNYGGGTNIPLSWKRTRSLGLQINPDGEVVIAVRGNHVTPQDVSVFQRLLISGLQYKWAQMTVCGTTIICTVKFGETTITEEDLLFIIENMYAEENNRNEDVTETQRLALVENMPFKIHFKQRVDIDPIELLKVTASIEFKAAPEVFVRRDKHE